MQHPAVHGGRVLGVAQTVDGQLGGRGTGVDRPGQIGAGASAVEVQVDREARQAVGQQHVVPPLRTRLPPVWAMERIRSTWRCSSALNG